MLTPKNVGRKTMEANRRAKSGGDTSGNGETVMVAVEACILRFAR